MIETEKFLDDNLKTIRKAELISKLQNKDEQDAIGSLNNSLDLNLDYLTNLLFTNNNDKTLSSQINNNSILPQNKSNNLINQDKILSNKPFINSKFKPSLKYPVLFVNSLNEYKNLLKSNE